MAATIAAGMSAMRVPSVRCPLPKRAVVRMAAAGLPRRRVELPQLPQLPGFGRKAAQQKTMKPEVMEPLFDPLGLEVEKNFPGAVATAEVVDVNIVDRYEARGRSITATSSFDSGPSGKADFGNFFKGNLPGKVGTILLLLALSRVGVYIPIDGVDRAAFAESMSQCAPSAIRLPLSGILSYVDTLSGGSISKLGIFSLGIVPFINSSIIFQLLGSVFPSLEKLQKEEGIAGRRKFNQYQRYGALGFAVAQVLYVRPYVDDFSLGYLATSSLSLTCGAMILMYIGEVLTELKLGNGTSLLIFVSIVSSLPTSIGETLTVAEATGNQGGLALFAAAFIAITTGIVYVQEAERKIPINYASRYKAGGLQKSSYLPFKVNSAGVMPIIFASSLLALPSGLARFSGSEALQGFAALLYPGQALYLPVNVGLICFFNYFYTFLQLDPKNVADQLKRQGASIPTVRPGRATSDYIETVLSRLSILGSLFLGMLAITPGAVEAVTHLETFRGFAGTSVLILVGVATDTARKVKSELVMQEYDQLDDYYKN